MPAKLLSPWEALDLDIPELDQKSYPKNVCSSCGRYCQRESVEYPLLWQGGLDLSRKLYLASDPERCRWGVHGTSAEASVPGPEKVDRLRARRTILTAMICRKDRGLSSKLGVLSLAGQV